MSRIKHIASRQTAQTQLAKLTQREREVMSLIALGKHNRDIAEALGISPRTVEVYKARMMQKLQAKSLSDVIKIALGVPPP